MHSGCGKSSAHRCLDGLRPVAPAFPISTLRDLSLADATGGESAVSQDGPTAGDTDIDNATSYPWHHASHHWQRKGLAPIVDGYMVCSSNP